MVIMRGFGVTHHYLSRFFRERGFQVEDFVGGLHISRGGKRATIQIGHVWFTKPMKTGNNIGYLVTEGKVSEKVVNDLKGFNHIVVPSIYVQRKLREVGLESTVIPHGIDIEMFKPMNVERRYDLLTVGIIESHLDNRKMMNVAEEIRSEIGLKYHIHTQSNLRYEEVPTLYNQAKVYLSITGVEAFNIPFLEAMACGLPTVYNDSPPLSEFHTEIAVKPMKVEMVGMDTFFEVHYPDKQEIIKTVKNLFQDERRMNELGKRNREIALNYDYRRVYEEFLSFI
jgi:glycosyltransferase involved in cell wall biosynthesis